MPQVSVAVEYGLHCLLFLVGFELEERAASARELAELQGLPSEYTAKLFTKLQKAGLVAATEGVRGGFRLSKSADAISVLDVVTAIDGDKALFECQGVRARCALFGTAPPAWAVQGVCSIHAVMLEAEARMRQTLASHTLADLAARTAAKAPADFGDAVGNWLRDRADRRGVHNASSVTVGDVA